MSEEESKALEAARLYGEDATFQTIAEKLEVSKSHAQVLTRRGIALSMEAKTSETDELTHENPVTQQNGGNPHNVEIPSFPFPQDPRTGSYELMTKGIGRRVLLTPADIMIYDLFRDGGFPGDLSQFISDSINFMYNNVRPAERK